MNTVTASEANRSFSKLLRAVERGERVEITSHGRKVAMLVPSDDDTERRTRQLATLEKLKKRWAEREVLVAGTWTRDDLNARD